MTIQVEPSVEQIREFVIAGHGNLPRVREMLKENPAFLNVAYEWSPDDTESAIQGAAHVGNIPIIEYLLAQGAPLEIYTAATLGRSDVVQSMLTEDPVRVQSRGAHGIPLLTHAALSGNLALVQMLYKMGAVEGASAALGNAVAKGYADLASWLLANATPDLSWQNFQGKTLLAMANEQGHVEIAELLRQHGATE